MYDKTHRISSSEGSQCRRRAAASLAKRMTGASPRVVTASGGGSGGGVRREAWMMATVATESTRRTLGAVSTIIWKTYLLFEVGGSGGREEGGG